jgi:PAS domain S-box-containing protein
VLDRVAENTVFRRYNTAVVVAFIIIVFIALTAASLRYYSELSVHKQQGLEQLTAQAEQLNSMLVQSEQAISGIQEFAQYILKYPDELHAKSPPLRQDDSLFFLDKPIRNSFEEESRISGNITGFGDVEKFSLMKKQEIAMANALTPAFVTAKKVIEEANWFYYVSVEQFVNIFPWIGRDSWRFSDRMLTNAHAIKIQELGLENNKVIWSSPYIDAAGTGLNVSLGIGVYRNVDMLGAVIIDISLARLQQSLPKLSSDTQSLVLLNQDNDILIFKQQGKEPLGYRASWQKLLPEGLHHLNKESLSQLSESSQIGDWFVEKQTLPINGWTLLKYQPYSSFTSPLRDHFIFMFAILLIGLLAFLMLVNAMTKRSFIKPTHDFISHIEFCAQGDPGKIKANADWLHWFMLVEDIFTQNRSLLLQLKEQNEVLDSRVLEKTRALQESSAKHQRDYVLLRSVMNAIPDLIIFNDPDGKLMGCNQAFERLSGCLEGKMLGFHSIAFMPKLLALEIETLNEKFHHEYPQQALIEAGEESYQGFCNQFTNEQGEILGTITILQDVTEQQATQSALEKAKNQAEYANQVKIQFLANMSHEIRTPINAIQGMMDLLTRTELDSRQHHYLGNAQTAAFSLLHLIDELLDLSKIEAGKMIIVKEVIDLPSVINTALKLNSTNLYIKKLNMRVELAANVPSLLMGDEMRLVQVLSNLLNNAVKFTEQGEIALFIDSIGLSTTNALIRFKITDTGIGISKENQKHLFEAFSQADISMTRKYGGSGLGLSICQQIVKLLGGEITLKSDLGAGCEFNFILPFSLPNENISEKADFNNTTDQPNSTVHICAIKQELSISCIDTIKQLTWSYHHFDDLFELDKAFFNENKALSVGKVVLLVSEEVLAQHKANVDDIGVNLYQHIDLIGLCQPTMRELGSNTCHLLDEMNVSYILLDTPLFRYSLEEIAEALFQEQKGKNKLVLTEEHNSRNEPALLKNENEENRENLSNINVLLVEDNLVNQLVAKELLMSLKAKVVIAENGQKALDSLGEHKFDVVLMDIQMPIMDGLTATQEIRKQEEYQSLPIIAMTAHAREEDKQRSLAAGMNLHIAKPVTAKILSTSILQAIKLETL